MEEKKREKEALKQGKREKWGQDEKVGRTGERNERTEEVSGCQVGASDSL